MGLWRSFLPSFLPSFPSFRPRFSPFCVAFLYLLPFPLSLSLSLSLFPPLSTRLSYGISPAHPPTLAGPAYLRFLSLLYALPLPFYPLPSPPLPAGAPSYRLRPSYRQKSLDTRHAYTRTHARTHARTYRQGGLIGPQLNYSRSLGRFALCVAGSLFRLRFGVIADSVHWVTVVRTVHTRAWRVWASRVPALGSGMAWQMRESRSAMRMRGLGQGRRACALGWFCGARLRGGLAIGPVLENPSLR
ncbi:hypothetical protein B0H15DRAFT_378529 [Mycena belliarum]|uniref:Uncharacterized protein n=1 Tax=Mycena belliarum TaxID=1033014 RepID=A0AAD6U1G9_9AGAR|nr:hypothetical protein B0H15DRAFT_378529 [Mycena belliae]